MGRNGGKKKTPVRLKFAEQVVREHFDLPFAKYGLIAQHEYLDDTDYFNIPPIGGLELLWYFCMGTNNVPRAVLELGIDGTSYSRLIWESEKGWNYSMMGAEDESQLCDRGKLFLHNLNEAMRTSFTVGIEHPIREGQQLDELVTYHSTLILTARNLP